MKFDDVTSSGEHFSESPELFKILKFLFHFKAFKYGWLNLNGVQRLLCKNETNFLITSHIHIYIFKLL